MVQACEGVRSERIARTGSGVDIVSTFPIALSMAGCDEPGYSLCAVDRAYRHGDGTSFVAPLASAVAYLAFGRA